MWGQWQGTCSLSREWWEGRSEVGSWGPVQHVLSASLGPRKMLGVPGVRRKPLGGVECGGCLT